MTARLALIDVAKTFTMHLQGGVTLPVVRDVSFSVAAGECVVLTGPSGAGKSSILKMVHGSYSVDRGQVLLEHGGRRHDIAAAAPRHILALRREAIGYVSQFLRVVPRVPAREVVAEPLLMRGHAREAALTQAEALLARLNLPRRLWDLPPATFSGGEQQRVNVARGFAAELPLLLLDEPTASLDAENRAVVIELIEEKKRAGAALLGIFHDAEVREQVADRLVPVASLKAAA